MDYEYADFVDEYLDKFASSGYDESIECDYCYAVIAFGTPQCANCKHVYSDEFWRSVPNSDISQTPNFDNNWDWMSQSDIIEYYDEDINLCCDQPSRFCDCVGPARIGWEEVSWIDPEIYAKAYTDQNSCIGCFHFYKASCIWFRNWALDAIRLERFPGSIDSPCENFLKNDDIQYELDFNISVPVE